MHARIIEHAGFAGPIIAGLTILLCLLLGVEAGASEAPNAWGRSDARVRAEIRLHAEALERPADWTEANAALRALSHAICNDAEPKRTAIRALGDLESPLAAPPLIAVLHDRASPYRVEAVTELERSFDANAPEALIAALESSDALLRRSAARVLGTITAELPVDEEQRRSARAALARRLEQDPEPRVRLAALDGLVSLGTEQAMYAAFTLGERDTSEIVRCGLVRSSREYVTRPDGERITPQRIRIFLRGALDSEAGAQPVGVLTRAYRKSGYYSPLNPQSDCFDVREAAMSELALLEDPAALPALQRATSESDPGRRATAARALARYPGNGKALAAVASALADPTAGVRKAAIEGLGESSNPRADAHLIPILRSGAPADRLAAAKALHGSFGASEALIEAFADRTVQVRDESEVALLRSDEVVVKLEAAQARISAEAGPDGPDERSARRLQRIANALERWQGERRAAERSLAQGLSSSNPRVRIRSARVMAKFESRESLALLIESLQAGQSPGSETAALALGIRGDPTAQSALERAARSDSPALAVAAIRALSDLGSADSLPLLHDLEAKATDAGTRAAAGYARAMLERSAAVH